MTMIARRCSCWIAQQDGLAIYGFYYPMAATFIATSVLYFLVLRQVWLIQAAVRRAPVVYEVRLEEGDGAAAGEERESVRACAYLRVLARACACSRMLAHARACLLLASCCTPWWAQRRGRAPRCVHHWP